MPPPYRIACQVSLKLAIRKVIRLLSQARLKSFQSVETFINEPNEKFLRMKQIVFESDCICTIFYYTVRLFLVWSLLVDFCSIELLSYTNRWEEQNGVNLISHRAMIRVCHQQVIKIHFNIRINICQIQYLWYRRMNHFNLEIHWHSTAPESQPRLWITLISSNKKMFKCMMSLIFQT